MNKPLAIKLAPTSLKDVIGQDHLIGKGKILTNLVKGEKRVHEKVHSIRGAGAAAGASRAGCREDRRRSLPASNQQCRKAYPLPPAKSPVTFTM